MIQNYPRTFFFYNIPICLTHMGPFAGEKNVVQNFSWLQLVMEIIQKLTMLENFSILQDLQH